jgi:hypothetical protein
VKENFGRINVKILKNRLGGYVDTIFPMAVNYETLKITDWDSTDDDSEADITVFNEIENKKISDDSAEINELFENM